MMNLWERVKRRLGFTREEPTEVRMETVESALFDDTKFLIPDESMNDANIDLAGFEDSDAFWGITNLGGLSKVRTPVSAKVKEDEQQ